MSLQAALVGWQFGITDSMIKKGMLALEVGLLGFSKSEAVPQRVKGVQAGVLHLDRTFKSPGAWGGLETPMQGHTPDQDLQTH